MARNVSINFEDARITFRNFRGEKGRYNKEGDRNFNLILTEEQADIVRGEGLRVKVKAPTEEYPDPLRTVAVKVSYRRIAPIIEMITNRGKVVLTEDTVGELDYQRFKKVDLSINVSRYINVDGEPSATAYLDSMYVTVMENALADKYRDVPNYGD